MKYLYLLTALIFMGCSDKSVAIEKLPESKQKMEVVKADKVTEVVETSEITKSKHELLKNETLVDEPKVTKKIARDVPSSCAMWSDGSNICTRVSKKKASCTTNPIENRMFSCLQWQ